MAKILKAEAGGQVWFDFPDEADVWVTLDLAFQAAALALWTDPFGSESGHFVTLRNGFVVAGVRIGPSGWVQAQGGTTGAVPAPVADAFQTVELHLVNGGVIDVIVDGVTAITQADGYLTDVNQCFVGLDSGSVPAEVSYITNVKIGTTQGGSDIFADDFDDGTIDAWTGSSGDVSVITELPGPPVPPSLADGGRVLVAFDDPALEPDPTWTTVDGPDYPNLVAGIDIHRGRQTELDQTETSTATVHLHDTDGLFDPANTGSPYFGLLDGKQITLQCWNPVALEWVPQWRGFIDDYGYDLHPSQVVSNIQIQCVDGFDYLAGVEMIPGLFGDAPPAGSEGVVFYEDTDFQTRAVQLLTDADWPSALRRVFTGNVEVQETRYDAGDSILAALRDVADAEFPGIANLYVDKLGIVCLHGRFARFDPDSVSFGTDWNFRRWKAGDGAAIILDPDRAQIRPPLTWSRPRSRIVNAGLAYPRFMETDYGGGTFTETDIPGQSYVDAPSITAFGYRSWSASDLITLRGTTTMNNAQAETRLFAAFYVENYKLPRTRVEALTFKSIDPDDPRAAATWALICGADISDVVNLEHGYPGGVGLSENFYIEGSEMTIRPLNPDYDMVELTLNVSAASYYDEDVFA